MILRKARPLSPRFSTSTQEPSSALGGGAHVLDALQSHQRPEGGLGERAQVDLAEAAAGEGLHRPGTLELVDLDDRVEHRERADALGRRGGQLEADRAADVVHHEVEAVESERVDRGER